MATDGDSGGERPPGGLKGWLRHAFAVEPFDESCLLPEEKAVLERLARQIHSRRLTSPAILWLQSNRHMNWLGSQFLIMLAPFFDMTHPFANAMLRNFGLNLPPADYPVLCQALEKRYSVEYLVQRLEARAAGEYNDQPAIASDSPDR